MDNVYAPLSESCAKQLGDKAYDKRKIASTEIEKMVVEFNVNRNYTQIQKLINVIRTEFCANRDPNKRKGGLLGFASIALALGKNADKFLNDLVFPILNCCLDSDYRVRYFAVESLYNVVKVARTSIITVFPEIFSTLSKLSADPDQQVKNGSELLDRLLKDIVTESYQTFDLDSFVPLIRERIYTKNPFARQFIISWVSVLNAVPEINMVVFLPEILDGLFHMLDDSSIEIQRMCDTLLAQFLKNIRNDVASADIPAMTNILITHSQSGAELIQFTAISWLREFVQLAGPTMLTFASGIFQAVLPCLAYEEDARKREFVYLDFVVLLTDLIVDIRDCAAAVNTGLLELVTSGEAAEKERNLRQLDLGSVMRVLAQYLAHESVNTKVAVLKWIHHLFVEVQEEMSTHADSLKPALLETLTDSSDDVVLEGLIVLAEIVNASKSAERYRSFICSLLELFKRDPSFLKYRGNLIIRQLCILLNAEQIYRTFADILAAEKTDVKFASTMVRTLNAILVTSPELYELRSNLKDPEEKASAELFVSLYKSWAHCPISTLSLCLLGQCYQHVSKLVANFAEIEITIDFLVEIDKLVQLIESPIFANLRLTLVSHSNNVQARYLAQALYGILMVLPQTDAFHLLRNRLQCVPNYWGLAEVASPEKTNTPIDFEKLLKHFQDVQSLHRSQNQAQRRKNIQQWEERK